MKETTRRTVPEEFGDLMRWLERQQAEFADRQAQMRLLLEETRKAAGQEEGGAPGWVQHYWQGLVELVNEQARGRVAAALGPGLSEAVARFRTGQAEPLGALTDDLAKLFAGVRTDVDADMRHVMERYADVTREIKAFAAGAAQLAEATQPASRWTGNLDLPRSISPREFMTTDGEGTPQLRLAPLYERLEQAANDQLRAYFRQLAAERKDGEAIRRQLGELEGQVPRLLLDLLDLKHSLATAMQERRSAVPELYETISAAVRRLQETLRALGMEEIDVQPGHRVNDVHVVRDYENSARTEPGTVIRVLLPGCRYRGELHRKAHVVATR